MSDQEPRCVICGSDMLFEVPAAPDGQVEELVCRRCGAAEVVTPVVAHLWPARQLSVPHQRRAA
ncbi:hypothetical protein [Paractinoplanes brasiliensis]|uniref:Uncharacterized protein n=1 Tax=Paractinoplanes brasiliensis TaxID=52695 RepID=A0A4R6JMX0_9ACTN|nr:hypothetical protein [Actinoplanes brasiliensis]TDO37793.1 hypothetical protein C8E87_1427 [Actinoplanes brasiliensis]GID32135.1 hypothetical protein Abr02nite_71180 [Actinoplanes brasiliensis]